MGRVGGVCYEKCMITIRDVDQIADNANASSILRAIALKQCIKYAMQLNYYIQYHPKIVPTT